MFIKNKKNILINVETFFHFNSFYSEEFPFMVYVKGIPSYSGHFLVNQEDLVDGFDKRIFEMFHLLDID